MAGMFGTSDSPTGVAANRAFKAQLNKVYTWYTGGFLVFILPWLTLCKMLHASRYLTGR